MDSGSRLRLVRNDEKSKIMNANPQLAFTVPTLTLSGWVQPFEALTPLMHDAQAIDYEDAEHPEAVIEQLASHADLPLAIGWSLGGWLLMLAAARGIIRPHLLVVLAAPVQFVACDAFPHGMAPPLFDQFNTNVRTQPERAARRFAHLIAHGDRHYDRIVPSLEHTPMIASLGWQRWLTHLEAQRHTDIDYRALPPTLFIYGEEDRIVSPQQGRYLHAQTLQSHLAIWPECAHAPHLHDASKLRTLIMEHYARAVR